MKKYFRKFTALLPNGGYINKKNWIILLHLRDLFLVILVIVAGVILYTLVILSNNLKVTKLKYEQYKNDYLYWESVSLQYPQIPDVLYNSAVSAYKVGEVVKAVGYLDKALKIDPLFLKAINLRSEIINKSK